MATTPAASQSKISRSIAFRSNVIDGTIALEERRSGVEQTGLPQCSRRHSDGKNSRMVAGNGDVPSARSRLTDWQHWPQSVVIGLAAVVVAVLLLGSAAETSGAEARNGGASRSPGVVRVGAVSAAAAFAGDLVAARPGGQLATSRRDHGETLIRVRRSGGWTALPMAGSQPSDVAIAGSVAWVVNSVGDPRAPATQADTLEAVDLRSSSVRRRVSVDGVYRVAVAGRSLATLVLNGYPELVVLEGGSVRWRLRLPQAADQYLAASRSFAWVVGTQSRAGRRVQTSLVRIDLRRHRVDRRLLLRVLPGGPPTLARGTLWLPSSDGLVHLTSDLRLIRYTKISPSSPAVTVLHGSVWVGALPNRLLRLNHAGTKIVGRRTIPGEPDELVATGSGIWVIDRTHGSAIRVTISG